MNSKHTRTVLLLSRSISYYPPIYIQVFLVVSVLQTYQIKFCTHFSYHPCVCPHLLLQFDHPNIQTNIMQWCRCQRVTFYYTYLNSEALLGRQLCHFNRMLEYFNVIDVDRDVFCCLEALQCYPHLTRCCEVFFQDERHQPDPAHSVTCLWKWQQAWNNSALNCHFHKIFLRHLGLQKIAAGRKTLREEGD